MGLYRPCHEYIAGEREDDPALDVIKRWIAKHRLVPSKIWPGMDICSWPPLESYNPERNHDPTTLMVDLVSESEYADCMPNQPGMQMEPGVLAVFHWL